MLWSSFPPLALSFFKTLCLYVYIAITFSKSKDQPGKVANPARGGHLNSENEFFPVPVRAREFGLAIPLYLIITSANNTNILVDSYCPSQHTVTYSCHAHYVEPYIVVVY